MMMQTACAAACGNCGGSPVNQLATYTVTLHLNGGVLPGGDTIEFYEYTEIILPQNVTRSEYKFAGWYDNAECTGKNYTVIEAVDATSDKEFWAKWDKLSIGEPDTSSKKYTVTFDSNYDGAAVESYKINEGEAVPDIGEKTRTGYEFLGWYTEREGGRKYDFTQGVTNDFTLYAHWQAKTYNVVFETNGGVINSGNFSAYTYGTSKPLPVDVTKDGSVFNGWYTKPQFEGNNVTEISKTDTGDKIFYAKWTIESDDSSTLKITASGGYGEGAFVELNLLENATADDYEVTYSGGGVFGTLDSELVRVTGGAVRADIVGLAAGKYTIRVFAKGQNASVTVDVIKYDRSGYAHFNYIKGVGAYKDDGTLKDNAIVVYLTEETKNTVKARIGTSVVTGLGNILKKAGTMDGQPLVIRILGTIGAPSWKEINYNLGGNYDKNNPLPAEKVIGINGKRLPNDHKEITQEELIDGGYNELDASVYSELNGLDSKAVWDSAKNEYTSEWNNFLVAGVKNITVEGIGTDARIFGWGFTWKGCNSVEVRNLTFEAYPDDACSFEGGGSRTDAALFDSKNIWVHNNTFLEGKNYWDISSGQNKRKGDGATDLKTCAYVTLAYNRYYKNQRAGLVGEVNGQTASCITCHHNLYEDCVSVMQFAGQSNIHAYNNYYKGSTAVNLSICAGGYAFIEYCYFDTVAEPVITQTAEGKHGIAKIYQCAFGGKAIGESYLGKTVYIVTGRAQQVPDSDSTFNNQFDTDETIFYYDIAEERTKLDDDLEMLTAEQVKIQLPIVSGVLKKSILRVK